MYFKDVLDIPDKQNFIYALCCPDTNEVKYIGLSTNGFKRIKDHYYLKKDSNSTLPNNKRWIKELKKQNKIFKVVYLEQFDNDGNHLDEAEQFWISYFKFIGANLLNHENGGRHNYRRNDPIFKKQIVEHMKKVNGSEEKRLLFSEKTKNIWNDKEKRNKLLESRKQNYYTKSIIDNNNNEYNDIYEASEKTGISKRKIKRILSNECSKCREGYTFRFKEVF